jgi:hypothetical protein
MHDDREGVESQISPPTKRTPEFTEKNFRRGNIFFRLLFFGRFSCQVGHLKWSPRLGA